MTEILRDEVVIHASPKAVWSLISDAAALQRVLPGAEAIVETGPGRFRGVLASRIQFLTVKADVDARFEDADPPRHLRLQMSGRPRGLAGSFSVSIPFDLEPLPGDPSTDVAPSTRISYVVDLDVAGRLAVFGKPLLADTMRREVAALLANVDRELATA
jgi:carbon monoxide dehydrogenase subunit G